MKALFRFHIQWMMIFLTAVCAVGKSFAQGAICDAREGFISASTPRCPIVGNLLPENYPVLSLSISDEAGGASFVEETVDQVLKAQPSPSPLLFLNVRPETFNNLKKHLQTSSWATAEMIAKLRLVQSTGLNEGNEIEPLYLNWQQDFYKGSFDRNTGLPVARLFENYPALGNLAKTFPEDLKACSIPTATLPTQFVSQARNGFSGGNIDMIPSGICLLGSADLKDQEWETYSKSICGTKTSRIKVPTEWLSTGHTDEVFKAVPTNDSAPCNFALAFASPRMALESMSQNPDGQAFDFPRDDRAVNSDEKLISSAAMQSVCASFGEIMDAEKRNRPLTTPIASEPFSKTDPVKYMTMSQIYLAPHFCVSMKNRDVTKTFQTDVVFRELNQLVQEKMDAFKVLLMAQVKKNLPQCQIRAIDVPTLFQGMLKKDSNGQYQIYGGAEYGAHAIFPNPTNSLVIGKSLLFPKPFNKTFEQNLVQRFSSLGLKTDFVDTFESHRADGNLHCATQILRYCRP